MKKQFLSGLFCLLLLAFVSSTNADLIIGTTGISSGARVYLFYEDFEGTDTVWDATTGTYDCNLDTQGDWCDDYDTTPAPIKGSESLGFMADYTEAWVREGLGGSYSELYADFWVNTDDVTGVYFLYLQDSTQTTVCQVQGQATTGYIRVYCGAACLSSITLTEGVDWHIRVYYKEGAGDGVIKIWGSTTDEDFDGDTANQTCNNLTTDTDDIANVRIPGGDDSGNGDKSYYDNVGVWQPDGNE